MHTTVNERLKMQINALQAQASQFRLILGVLVHRLGGDQSVSETDVKAMQELDARFRIEPKEGAVLPDGSKEPDVLRMRVLTGEEAKQLDEQASRIVQPEAPKLVVVQ